MNSSVFTPLTVKYLTTILTPDMFNTLTEIIGSLDKLDSFNLIYYKDDIIYNPIDRYEDRLVEIFNNADSNNSALIDKVLENLWYIVNESLENMGIEHNIEYLYQIKDLLNALYELIWSNRKDLIEDLEEVLETKDDDEITFTFSKTLVNLTGMNDLYSTESITSVDEDYIKVLISRNNDITTNEVINTDENMYNLLKNLPIEYIATSAYRRIVNDDYNVDTDLVNNLKALYRDIENDNKVIENCVLYLILSKDSKLDPVKYIDTIDFNVISTIEADKIDNYKILIKNELNRIQQ